VATSPGETEIVDLPARFLEAILPELGHRKGSPVNGVDQRKPEHDSPTEEKNEGGEQTSNHRRKP
jgi:hypothetical protein